MFERFQSPATLMVQGCTSDAGKSVMVAGICRVLARSGGNVAPFKPQNMALNSAVTADGGEIGRAQALQAQACFLDAHTDFNPILLKPSSDVGAQVIIHGQAIHSMQASEYHDYKRVAMNAVLESHQRLSAKFDKVVVEGAGSPAEINLREGDIANMGFAEAVDCPVILIADIDRGGVFAHLVGTLELLSSSEQDRVVGFIINRFRGDISLLQPGLDWLEQRTGKPVLGVVPYLNNLYLDAEDAISVNQVKNQSTRLKIAVPVLPRISNHTDFDALRLHPEVDLQFVAIEDGCPRADLIILPGSKNVIADLVSLKQTGWDAGLRRHLRYGGKLIGLCGGYQMLGDHIADPSGVENNSTAIATPGLGLLRAATELHPAKQLSTVDAEFCADGFDHKSVRGYEIHCGVTTSRERPLLQTQSGPFEGSVSPDNAVLGTYLHGLFDQPSACNTLLQWAGLTSTKAVDLNAAREAQLERLADCLEDALLPEFWQALHSRKICEVQPA